MVRETVVRSAGLAMAAIYAAAIVWTYARQPQTLSEVAWDVSSAVGAYRVNEQAFADGLAFFRNEQFVEARAAFGRADPASRDARTQFYVAYSYYRQGWGRIYNDDRLFASGLEHIDLAIQLAPGGRLVVEDDDLKMRSADEVRAELQRGLERDISDLNPLRLFEERK